MPKLIKHPTKPWSLKERKRMIRIFGGKGKIQASLFEYLLEPEAKRTKCKINRSRLQRGTLIRQELFENPTIPAELKNFVIDIAKGGSFTTELGQRQISNITNCMNPDKMSRQLFIALENLRADLIYLIHNKRRR